MDFYYGPGGTTAGAVAKTDQTLGNVSGSGSGAWADPLTRARLGLAPYLSPSRSPPSAFLAPAFNACASDTSDVDPTLLRLTRSHHLLRYSSPPPEKPPPGPRRLLHMKSPIRSGKLPPPKSPASYKATPMRMAGMEEDVLVMDGVLVTDARPNIRRNNSAEFGSSGNSSSSGTGVFYKPDLGRFAQGKEDLRGPRSWKQKNEVVGTKSVPSAGSGKYSSRFSCYISLPGPNTGDSGLTKKTVTKLAEIAPTAAAPVASKPLPSSTFTWPPTAEEDVLIKYKLYGPSSRRRLPVFWQICVGQ